MSARGRVRKEGPVGIDTFETLSERMTAVRILDRKSVLERGSLRLVPLRLLCVESGY